MLHFHRVTYGFHDPNVLRASFPPLVKLSDESKRIVLILSGEGEGSPERTRGGTRSERADGWEEMMRNNTCCTHLRVPSAPHCLEGRRRNGCRETLQSRITKNERNFWWLQQQQQTAVTPTPTPTTSTYNRSFLCTVPKDGATYVHTLFQYRIFSC